MTHGYVQYSRLSPVVMSRQGLVFSLRIYFVRKYNGKDWAKSQTNNIIEAFCFSNVFLHMLYLENETKTSANNV